MMIEMNELNQLHQLDERAKMAALAAKRSACPNRVNGYCSPICPDCPCYRDGRCAEVDLKEAK